jgi:hypothetical protein
MTMITIMKDSIIKVVGLERWMKWSFNIRLLLNFKYRKSFYEVKKKFRKINETKNKTETLFI